MLHSFFNSALYCEHFCLRAILGCKEHSLSQVKLPQKKGLCVCKCVCRYVCRCVCVCMYVPNLTEIQGQPPKTAKLHRNLELGHRKPSATEAALSGVLGKVSAYLCISVLPSHSSAVHRQKWPAQTK